MAGICDASHVDLLKYLWLVKSNPESGEEEEVLYAGALCINREGVLITVTHGIKPNCRKFEAFPSLQAQTYVGPRRSVDWIQDTKYQTFGMSLLKIQKLEANEQFDSFPIPDDDLSLDVGTGIRAFVCGDGVPFSFLCGRVCYPFGGVLEIPQNEFQPFILRSTPPHLETRTVSHVATEENFSSKNSKCITRRPDLLEMIGTGVFQRIEWMNPSMPLVQVSGLVDTTMDGQCGWPVFTEHNQLIGLVTFSTGCHQFVIPAKIVREVVKRNIKLIRHVTGTSSRKDGSGEGSKRSRRS